MQKNQQVILQNLIKYGLNREELMAQLVMADSVDQSLVVTKNDLKWVLGEYLLERLESDDLEEWALLVENCNFFQGDLIEDYLFALSHSELMGGITKETVRVMHSLL